MLLTVDVEQAFDSVDPQFLINVLDTFGSEKNLVRSIRILLKIQFCIIDGAITVKYFKLERGTCQGDPISAITQHSVRSSIWSDQIKINWE